MKLKVLVTQWSPTLCDCMDCSHQASLSMEFSRQECWIVLPFSSPGYLPNPGIEPGSPALQADSLHNFHSSLIYFIYSLVSPCI